MVLTRRRHPPPPFACPYLTSTRPLPPAKSIEAPLGRWRVRVGFPVCRSNLGEAFRSILLTCALSDQPRLHLVGSSGPTGNIFPAQHLRKTPSLLGILISMVSYAS